MKFAINLPNFGYRFTPLELTKIAVEVEQAGWDGFFLWDHMAFLGGRDIYVLDPWICLTAIAMKTEKIKIGTLITPIPRRRPWKLARETVTLDHLSDGRLILGIGIGNPEYDFTTFGEDFNPVTRAKKLEEGLKILQGLWTGTEYSFEGDYYQIKKVQFLPTPVNGQIPIWVAGMWPNKKPFIRASQHNGVCPLSTKWPQELTPREVTDIKDFILENRKINANFDIVISGNSPGDPSEWPSLIKPYEEAGTTWWCENINGFRFSNSVEKMIERIQQGPPIVN
jgi:alkanesulfonate monooxygenase SsuD/methylene tetrahydromethanopterin reductase-like flavin-dependent oxidoreductase (luciferase family)